MVAVHKDAEGNVKVMQETQLDEDEAKEFGAIVGGLIGLGVAGEEGMKAGVEAGPKSSQTRTRSTSTRSGTRPTRFPRTRPPSSP